MLLDREQLIDKNLAWRTHRHPELPMADRLRLATEDADGFIAHIKALREAQGLPVDDPPNPDVVKALEAKLSGMRAALDQHVEAIYGHINTVQDGDANRFEELRLALADAQSQLTAAIEADHGKLAGLAEQVAALQGQVAEADTPPVLPPPLAETVLAVEPPATVEPPVVVETAPDETSAVEEAPPSVDPTPAAEAEAAPVEAEPASASEVEDTAEAPAAEKPPAA